MTETQDGSPRSAGHGSDDHGESVPFMQRLLDNHFLLLALGVAVPAVLYIVWGLMEVAMIPIAQ